MPDYIQLFIDMCESGRDMSQVEWALFQETAAEAMFDNVVPFNVEDGWEIH